MFPHHVVKNLGYMPGISPPDRTNPSSPWKPWLCGAPQTFLQPEKSKVKMIFKKKVKSQ